jgi:hypothetical protein
MKRGDTWSVAGSKDAGKPGEIPAPFYSKPPQHGVGSNFSDNSLLKT